jgi:hypothetical protein
MARDLLFLLKEDFPDGPGAPYYCPDCAQITGVLAYFPKLRYNWIFAMSISRNRARRSSRCCPNSTRVARS